jgi:hypothetical protein
MAHKVRDDGVPLFVGGGAYFLMAYLNKWCSIFAVLCACMFVYNYTNLLYTTALVAQSSEYVEATITIVTNPYFAWSSFLFTAFVYFNDIRLPEHHGDFDFPFNFASQIRSLLRCDNCFLQIQDPVYYACLVVFFGLMAIYVALFTVDDAKFDHRFSNQIKFGFVLFYFINFNPTKTHIISGLFQNHKVVAVFLMAVQLHYAVEHSALVVLEGAVFIFETGSLQKGRIHLATVGIYAIAKTMLRAKTFSPGQVFLLVVTTVLFMFLSDRCRRVYDAQAAKLVNDGGNGVYGARQYSVEIRGEEHYYNTVWYHSHNILCETCFIAEMILFCA